MMLYRMHSVTNGVVRRVGSEEEGTAVWTGGSNIPRRIDAFVKDFKFDVRG